MLIDDNGNAVLTDVGLSRIVEQTGASGSVRWMAHELIDIPGGDDNEGEPRVTPASDVWAFGMTALEVSLYAWTMREESESLS